MQLKVKYLLSGKHDLFFLFFFICHMHGDTSVLIDYIICLPNSYARLIPSPLRTSPFSLAPLTSTMPTSFSPKKRRIMRYCAIIGSKRSGSAAAPTAGLHFTNELLDEIRDMGVHIVRTAGC